MAKKPEETIEEILAMMRMVGLEITLYPQKLSTIKVYAPNADVTPDFICDFDIDDYKPKETVKYFVKLNRGSWRRMDAQYYWNESSSGVSLEKAVRNAWRKYLKDMEAR